MSTKNKIRLSFDVTPEQVEVLDHLIESSGLSNRKELLNASIALFDWAVKQKKNGKSIKAISSDGKDETEVIIPGISSSYGKVAKEKLNRLDVHFRHLFGPILEVQDPDPCGDGPTHIPSLGIKAFDCDKVWDIILRPKKDE